VKTAHIKQVVAAYLVGDGLVGVIRPRANARLWARIHWAPFRRAMQWFADHPRAARGIAATQAGVFLWIALRQIPAGGGTD
jgi:hypothetical protein